ncbi:DNA polymerase III subunit delta [Hydrogenobacter sp. T-2]|uniref:DNA polymerase III subunit delta n=1 Tax=Pampinifervens diazotrophicum TaxID=1632018 RepID=UPI002B256E71|nr:DNA polymerase III subunit delta [Hydrogenobacter sp. T-2]WPM31858.1 DNA polymerase III subunit delta [Hydrogenobacter sp. T-2]
MISLLEYQKNLGKGQIKAVNLIHGEEEYLIKSFLDKLREMMPVRILWSDELSLEDFIGFVGTAGMFAKTEALFIYMAEEFFKGIKNHKNLISYLERLKDKKVFFYVSYKLSDKDLQKEPFLSLSRLGDVIYAGKLDKRKVRELVKNKLQREGISIEDSALDYLLEASSYQLQILRAETDKLILYGKRNITLEDIKSVVIAELDLSLFDLSDGLFLKDYEKALNSINSVLMAGIHPLQVLTFLVNYTLKLYTAKTLVQRGWEVEKALSEVGIKHKFQVFNFKKYLTANSLENLSLLIRKLYLLDISVKVYYSDPAQALKRFVIEYMLHEEGTYNQTDTGNHNRADTES